jgi:hypothetical protein
MKVIPNNKQYNSHFGMNITDHSFIHSGVVETECFGYIRTDLDIFIVNCYIKFVKENGKYDGNGYEILNVDVYKNVKDWYHQDKVLEDDVLCQDEENTYCIYTVPFIEQRIKEGDWFNDLIRPYLDPYQPTKKEK